MDNKQASVGSIAVVGIYRYVRL